MQMQLLASQELRQDLRLAQIIEFSNLMAVPDEVLNTLVGAISFNPDSIEATLQERKRNNPKQEDGSKKVQSLYSTLVPSKGDPDNAGRGLVGSPDLRILEGCLGQYRAKITPDVTYVGRKEDKPELIFSDHLRGSMGISLLQLNVAKYPETARLVGQLARFDDWKRRNLQTAYVILGGVQREFFEDFEKERLNVFRAKSLAERLKFSESTVHRLLSNRWVEARNLNGEQKFLYAKDLLVSPDELTKYISIPILNKLLAAEVVRKKAYSDREIQEQAPQLARRTIAKYRLEAGIPETSVRNRSYREGRVEAYQIS